jgi:hypothetical protein
MNYQCGAVPPWSPLSGVPPPDDLPLAWDAGHCAKRLIHAYHVLLSVPGRIGPADLPRPWPEIILEFSDLIETRKERLSLRPRWLSFPAAELALAEEAIAWPLTFLADAPHRAEAVQLWAYAKATRRSLRHLLRKRRAQRSDPYRIRSDTALRRYLGPGLELLAARLRAAGVPVR